MILQGITVVADALETPAGQSDQQQTTADREPVRLDLLGITRGTEHYLEAVEALRDISKLREKFSKLQACVVELEEGKLDQSQLTRVKELITHKGTTVEPFCKSYICIRHLNQYYPDLY